MGFSDGVPKTVVHIIIYTKTATGRPTPAATTVRAVSDLMPRKRAANEAVRERAHVVRTVAPETRRHSSLDKYIIIRTNDYISWNSVCPPLIFPPHDAARQGRGGHSTGSIIIIRSLSLSSLSINIYIYMYTIIIYRAEVCVDGRRMLCLVSSDDV